MAQWIKTCHPGRRPGVQIPILKGQQAREADVGDPKDELAKQISRTSELWIQQDPLPQVDKVGSSQGRHPVLAAGLHVCTHTYPPLGITSAEPILAALLLSSGS